MSIPTPRNDHNTPIAVARAWIRSDRAAARDDVAAMGIEDAASAHMELVADCIADGDTRWGRITLDAMREALAELAELPE